MRTMANHVKVLLDFFGLLDKIIAYVKDEGSNLSTLILALTHVVICSPLQSTSSFVGPCFGHTMLKACQYAFDDSKICAGFLEISLKNVQHHCRRL